MELALAVGYGDLGAESSAPSDVDTIRSFVHYVRCDLNCIEKVEVLSFSRHILNVK